MSKIANVYHSIFGHTKLRAGSGYCGAQSRSSIDGQLYNAEEATTLLDELDAASTHLAYPAKVILRRQRCMAVA